VKDAGWSVEMAVVTTLVTDGLDEDLFRRIQDKVAIVGIGHLPFAKDIGRPISDTAVEAAQLALDDAGLVAEDVDGMVMFEMEHTHEVSIARRLGVKNLAWCPRSPTAAAPRPRRSCRPPPPSRAGSRRRSCAIALETAGHDRRRRGCRSARS
jgi:hypothetical protein